jgi:selenide,water dikinase
MTTLNRAAAEVVANDGFEAHAMTDITGFGLIGHARELALGSDVSLEIHAKEIPLLPGALECARAGHIPGGLNANRDFAECVVSYETKISDELRALLFDPQTAGGLLISIAGTNAPRLQQQLGAAGVEAKLIGSVHPAAKPLIRIR